MIAREDIEALIRGEGNVLGPEGEEIGGIGHVYLDDDTGEPCWVTVKTGLFGIRESFVPLEGAWIHGKDLIVQYGKDQVRDAPLVNPDEDPEPDEDARLYHHYRPGRKRTYWTYVESWEEEQAVREWILHQIDGLIDNNNNTGPAGQNPAGSGTPQFLDPIAARNMQAGTT